jgi:hypothetical protein
LWIITGFGDRDRLVICTVVKDDSPAAQPGYGHAPEEGEPTTRPVHQGDVAQPPGAAPVDATTAGVPRQFAGPEATGREPDATVQQGPLPAADHAGQASGLARGEGEDHVQGPYQPAAPATPYDDPESHYTYGDPSPHYGPFHGGGASQPEPPWTTGPDAAATSGAPSSGAATPSYPWEDRYGFDLAPARGPRIEPSPPPNRRKLVLGLLIGLAAGLLIFGTGGVIAGRATAPTAKPVPTVAPTTEPPLGLYEQSQSALNQPKFTGELTPIAQGWLPYLAGCSRSGTTNGPALNVGEKTRVRCTFDGMTAIFVEYTSVAARDKARVTTLGQNVDARTLTPGVGAAKERAAPSGRTSGNYVEYAYKLTENNVTRTVSGIWWDDARTPVAAYLLAYWKDGVGESWAPMRDIWTRYA